MAEIITTSARNQNYMALQAVEPNSSLAVSVSSSASSAQTTLTYEGLIRICATESVRYNLGSNPTATSTSVLLPAGVVEYIFIAEPKKIAFIRVSADGAVSVCPCI